MRTFYTPFHVLAAIAGLVIIAVDVGTNVHFMVDQTGTLWDTSVAAVVAVALGTAMALAAALKAIRQWRPVTGLVLILGFLLGAGFSLSATLDRVATLRDKSLETYRLSDERYVNLRKQFQRADDEAALECSPAKFGRGPNCKKGEAQVAALAERLHEREAKLNPLGNRLAAIIPGITADQATLYQPLLLPAALFVLGNWLFAFGMGGQRKRPEFQIEVSKRDAIELKASRFAIAFQAQQGRLPEAADLARNLGVSHSTAKRLASKISN